MQNNTRFSYASLSNLALIESLYEDFLKNPESVEISWRHFFEGMDFAQAAVKVPSSFKDTGAAKADFRVYALIHAYRTYGHLLARVNPLDENPAPEIPELDLGQLGFHPEDIDKTFPTYGFLGESTAPLRLIVERLKSIYCGSVGIEYMGFGNLDRELWIQKQFETARASLSADQKKKLLDCLTKVELFEIFIHTKYVGQTRFSIEGGESLIPLLIEILEEGCKNGLTDVVMGMAHRGRLNVLVNILGKPLMDIFAEFDGYYSPGQMESTGDVKYHKGLSSKYPSGPDGGIQVFLPPNPSHLESVNPVVEGLVRALQTKKGSRDAQNQVLPIIIHGDAAMAGQGVVYETMQLSGLNGYETCGTLHVAVNNQLGYTTLARDGRSTHYCTDIAKTFGAPVIHVNGEDPEACLFAAMFALSIRQKFQCDVFIDLNCYRKYGHNEGDEPNFTQPVEYKIIQNKKTVREIYRERLIQEGILDLVEDEKRQDQYKQVLKEAFEGAKNMTKSHTREDVDVISASARPSSAIKTAVPADDLLEIAQQFCKIPENFNMNPKVHRLFQDRLRVLTDSSPTPKIDWGMAEYLAYGSLLCEGIHVRLTGQDCRRGTFSHRHAFWVDQLNGERYFPLSHLKKDQALFDVFNSPLSEFACMGFEFGYSVFYPKALVIWEAQYGDFVNGAQVIIDQYLSSSEQKWNMVCSLTLLLPHAYEGQGPEHSSARLERFLQQCGQDNMQVANCTTPAQIFHLLRRQGLSEVKKPLIIFTPKGLLRHPACVSSLNDFSEGYFQEIIDDPSAPANPKSLYFCSGKVYYDLVAEREKRQTKDVAFVRIEQLYPLEENKLKAIIQKYRGFKRCVWIQEEHSNMGAWDYIRPYLDDLLDGKMQVSYIGRLRSAATSVGSTARHKKEYQQMMDEAFRDLS